MAERTGEYYEHLSSSSHRQRYFTFTPKALLTNDFYTLDDELFELLLHTYEALGILEGMVLYMPDNEILQELLIFKEAAYSLLIDNDDLDFLALLSARGCDENVPTLQRVVSANKMLYSQEINLESLEQAYTILKNGEDSAEREHIRSKPLFQTSVISTLRKYNPTTPEHIRPAINDIINYLRQGSSNSLVKAALTHYQFEMIRPFDTHNGSVGRLLAMRTLADVNGGAAKYLCLSEALYNTKNEYFDLLSSTQRSGGYIRWIKFFVGAVYTTARQNCEMIKTYQIAVMRDEAMLREHKAARNTFLVLEHWKRSIVSTITQAADELGLAFNTVERSVQLLQKCEILEQLPVKGRTRRFAYTALMDSLTGSLNHD